MTERNPWKMTREEVLREFVSDERGLSSEEAKLRLEQYGRNVLSAGKKKRVWKIFLEQFADFLVVALLLAAAVSGFLGDWESAVVILAVLILNAVLGTVQTRKAATSLESLKQLAAPAAKVLRDGQVFSVPGQEVVPGDVVVLEAGDSVCADGRLLECASLRCAEAALTGESVPVEKHSDRIEEDVSLGDRSNMVFAGSLIAYGRGKFLVTATGMNTEMGAIAALLKHTEEKKTPLQASLDQFGKRLSVMVLAVCVLLFAVSVFVRGEPIVQAFLFSVALAVAAIPEALGSIVTIVLSLGTQKMAKEHAIIRRLQAVEGLGSVSVICSDKTGTLTQNKMIVQKVYVGESLLPADSIDIDNPLQEQLLRAALLCSDATAHGKEEVGDPTEIALVRLGERYGMDEEVLRAQYPRLSELPFDSERKMMSTVHRQPAGTIMFTKGAVDVLMARCTVSHQQQAEIEAANEALSKDGLRVLAFGYKRPDTPQITLQDETQLEFLGLVAMMDPPREESAMAVKACIAAGIRPVMITGDHKITAAAIAREIGILTDGTEAVEGAVMESMSDEELQSFVPKVSVYARVSPEHKIRIVRAWQARGNLVAMTGDGVNDAPALKQADIGVAMGITGTEVAKDAAGMILTDDNFATIVQAVKHGRNIYANIIRAIHFLLSGNTAGLLTVLYASLAGLPVPFAAVHLLFINLLTDSLPAIALGLEPHSDDVMQETPRPRNEGILTGRFLRNVFVEGLMISVATTLAFYQGLRVGGAAVGSTMAFAVLCLSRLLHGFSSKADRPVLWSSRLWNNRVLLVAFAVGVVLLTAVLLVPALAKIFHVAALSAGQLGIVAALSFGSMVAIQLLKLLKKAA